MSDEVEVRFFEFLRRLNNQSDSSNSRHVGRSAGFRRKQEVMNFLADWFYELLLKRSIQTVICQF